MISPPGAAVISQASPLVVAPPPAGRSASQPAATGAANATSADLAEPTTDRHARALIARIRKNWNDVAAIRSLADHYGKCGDYASLANLMEGWGDALEDSRAAANAYVEAADALLLANRPGTEARVLYERALTRDASHVQALDRLTRVLEEAKNYDRLKQVLKYVAHQLQQHQASSPQLLANVHYRLGQVYEKQFDEPRKAATLYRQAIEENPRLISAISAARRLYLDQGNHKTVSLLFELEIEATENAEDKHALLLSLARHKREACDDLDGAVLAFRRAAKLIPTSVRALFGLAETLLARGENIDTPAGAADRKRAVDVFFHLAQRVSRAEAVPYLQRVLLVAPGHAQARAMLDSVPRKNGPATPPPAGRHAEAPSPEASSASWLNDADLVPVSDELSSPDLLPVEDDSAAESGSRPRPAARPSSVPPPALQTPRPRPKSQPPAVPPPRAPVAAASAPRVPAVAQAQQPQQLPQPWHPKICGALPDDPGRVALEVNVGSASDSNFYVDGSDELLDGGVFIATYTPLSVGARCRLTITLPGKVIVRAHGRVVLTRDLADAFENHIPGMCVAFERLDAKSAALIDRFTRKRQPTFIEF